MWYETQHITEWKRDRLFNVHYIFQLYKCIPRNISAENELNVCFNSFLCNLNSGQHISFKICDFFLNLYYTFALESLTLFTTLFSILTTTLFWCLSLLWHLADKPRNSSLLKIINSSRAWTASLHRDVLWKTQNHLQDD